MFSASVSFLKIFHSASFAKSNLEGCKVRGSEEMECTGFQFHHAKQNTEERQRQCSADNGNWVQLTNQIFNPY